MSCSRIMKAIGITVAVLATSVCAAGPADLVTVTVKGTSIKMLPTYVDIIVDDPKGQAASMVKRGAVLTEIKKHHDIVTITTLNKVSFHFFKSEDYNSTIKGHGFRVGDVVYAFTLRSPDEVAEFTKRHNLKLLRRIASQDDSLLLLYRASPGYYVICLVPVRRFNCSMHPQIIGKTEGKCPICAMNLMPVEAYEPFNGPEGVAPPSR